jgi:hypothetical protein
MPEPVAAALALALFRTGIVPQVVHPTVGAHPAAVGAGAPDSIEVRPKPAAA